MTLPTTLRIAALLSACLLLAGCYASETAIVTAEDALPVPGMTPGIYCHAENRLVPPQVTTTPTVSESLGENKCRDLAWDASLGQYVDARSPSMVFRTMPSQLPELWVLQVQTGEGAIARLMPVAAVDGMFLLYDPAGRWPADLVEAHGLKLTDDGTLEAADADAVAALVADVWETVLGTIRSEVAYVEDEAGPRLEFRDLAAADHYLVHFREAWLADEARMRGALLALAEELGLGMHEQTWTTARE